MAARIFEQLLKMFDACEYENVIFLAEMYLNTPDKGSETFGPLHKIQIYMMVGESQQKLGEPRKAENYYRKALDTRKAAMKCYVPPKSRKGNETMLRKVLTDQELKYRIAQCLVETRDYTDAVYVLETIVGRYRRAKDSLLLGMIHQRRGYDRAAIEAYKNVLQEQPLCLEAAEGLIELGLKAQEVIGIMSSASSSNPEGRLADFAWVIPYLRSHAAIKQGEFLSAVTALEDFEIPGPAPKAFSNNPQIVSLIGKAHFLNGDFKTAQLALARAHQLNMRLTENMDLLAAIYSSEMFSRDLDCERLADDVQRYCRTTPEVFLCQAHAARMAKRYKVAVALTHKAILVNPNNAEAQVLLGMLFLDQNNFKDGVSTLRHAVTLSPHRYEAHERAVDAYLLTNKTKEALNVAVAGCKQMGDTPRSMTLLASVMRKDSSVPLYKPRNLLEKAVAADEFYIPAVYDLAELYDSCGLFDKALELLHRTAEFIPDTKLHQMLGDIYLNRKRDEMMAMDHFTVALNLDPNNDRAIAGIQRVEEAPHGAESTSELSLVNDATTEEQQQTNVGDQSSDIEEVRQLRTVYSET